RAGCGPSNTSTTVINTVPRGQLCGARRWSKRSWAVADRTGPAMATAPARRRARGAPEPVRPAQDPRTQAAHALAHAHHLWLTCRRYCSGGLLLAGEERYPIVALDFPALYHEDVDTPGGHRHGRGGRVLIGQDHSWRQRAHTVGRPLIVGGQFRQG